MTQSVTPSLVTKSALDAAQEIVALFQGMSKDDQSLALRFAIETMRLSVSPMNAVTAAPQAGLQRPVEQQVVANAGQFFDIKSFTATKAPKSDRQFAAVVAYYYQIEARPSERRDTIDADTMKEAARLAGWPQVKRWAMTLFNAKNAGYLDPAGSGKFKLSSVGENLVAITLPSNSSDAPVSNGVSRKKASAKKSAARTKPKKRVTKKK